MNSKNKQSGFTLIELMITVAIVGILGAVATGYFGDNVISANRTDGRAALLENATVLEKCRAIYGDYDNANCSIRTATKEGYYTIAASTLTSSTYTLTATPVTGQPQTNDTECITMTLTNLGVQGDEAACW